MVKAAWVLHHHHHHQMTSGDRGLLVMSNLYIQRWSVMQRIQQEFTQRSTVWD